MGIKEKIPFYDSLVIPYHVGKAAFFGATKGFPGKRMTIIGVTGTNGKTIFLPASGYMANTNKYHQGMDVRLWTATEETYQKNGAYSFSGTYTSQYANTYELKFYGIAIRAIKDR